MKWTYVRAFLISVLDREKISAPTILIPHSCVTGQNAEWFWKWRWRKVPASLPVVFLPNISGAIAQLVPRPLRFEMSTSYAIINTHTHSLGFLWTSDQFVAGYTTHNRRVSIPSVGFKLTIPLIERQQTCALDRTTAGISLRNTRYTKLCTKEDGGNWALPTCEGRWLHIRCRLYHRWRLIRILTHVKPGNTCPPYTCVLYIIISTYPLRLDIPCDLWRTGFATTFHVTWPSLVIRFDVITLFMSGKQQTLKVWSPWLCNFLDFQIFPS
jgi:hypothetical protein